MKASQRLKERLSLSAISFVTPSQFFSSLCYVSLFVPFARAFLRSQRMHTEE